MNPIDNLQINLVPQVKWRQSQLFHDAEKYLKNKNVLEIAPGHCLFTEKMLELGIDKIDLVENDPYQAEIIKKYYKETSKVNVILDDIHFALNKLTPIYDTVICAGFLYHSPHPLWILEGIANLKPKYILIDTACASFGNIISEVEPVNQIGYRFTERAHSGVAIRLSPELYIFCLSQLGYKPIAQLNQKMAPVDESSSDRQKEILNGWKHCFSYWFERTN